MTALRELIEAVEAGKLTHEAFCGVPMRQPHLCPDWHTAGLCIEAENAFHGSLDAARALHDAVLPGWSAAIRMWGEATLVSPHGIEDDDDIESGVYFPQVNASCRGNPARAWLLAILKAMGAQQ